MGFVLFFISALAFSFSNAYWKKVVSTNSIYTLIFSRGLITTTFFGLLAITDTKTELFRIFLGPRPDFTGLQILLTILLCAFSFGGLYFFLKSTKEENASLTNTISSINIFGILTAVFILDESWKPIYWLIFLLIITALILLQKNNGKSEKKFNIKYGILASFFWGVAYTLFSYPIKWLGVSLFTFILEITITCICGILIYYNKFNLKTIPLNKILILAACIIIGSVFLHLSYFYLTVTKIIIFQKLTPVLSLFFCQFLYQEQLKKSEWVAIFLILVGISITVLN